MNLLWGPNINIIHQNYAGPRVRINQLNIYDGLCLVWGMWISQTSYHANNWSAQDCRSSGCRCATFSSTDAVNTNCRMAPSQQSGGGSCWRYWASSGRVECAHCCITLWMKPPRNCSRAVKFEIALCIRATCAQRVALHNQQTMMHLNVANGETNRPRELYYKNCAPEGTNVYG